MPLSAPLISVVIPAKNEVENLRPLVGELRQALDGVFEYELIYVDDGSTDGTADAVRAARRDGMPEIRLIRVPSIRTRPKAL